MTLALILTGLGLFTGLFLLAFYLFSRPSPERALLDRIAGQERPAHAAETTPPAGSHVLLEWVAAPFGALRGLFHRQPDSELERRLMLAGYKKPVHADLFLGARLALPAVLGITVAFLFTENVVVFFLMALAAGFFLPDIWLSRAIYNRKDNIRLSLPDALDLLSICMEAGLGLDQGILRVGQELRVSHPELSEEFLQINLEQRAGSPRMASWKNFAARVDTESARSFVALLIQTDRFGTPISKSLADYSDALRVQRRQRAEELAAKTTIKLVPPLVFFIFPDIFIVTVAPAVITVMKSIQHLAE